MSGTIRDTTAPTHVLVRDRDQLTAIINIGVKIGIFVAFFIAIVFPPAAVEGKAMGFRAPLFVGSALIIPVIATLRKWRPYPHTADALLAAPFLLDTLGNLFGFYERFVITDDVLHVGNWILLVLAYHAFRFRNVHDRRNAIMLGYGFGALAIIWWEILEWAVSVDGFGGAGGLSLTYEDTISDLFLSSTGGLVGSIIAIRLLGPIVSASTKSKSVKEPAITAY